MKILARLLTRMILVRFFAILIGISLFILTLEVVTYSREILALENSGAWILTRYILLRAPATLSTFLPLSLLLALLLSLTELSYRNELTSIWATGLSPLHVVRMLFPTALTAGMLHFILVDQGVPWAAPTLRSWAIADYGEKRLKVGEHDPIWLRSGRDIIRAASATDDSRQLTNVIIFRRNEAGNLTEQLAAQSAERMDEGWVLHDVVSYSDQSALPKSLSEVSYRNNMRPAVAGSRSGDPEEMTMADLSYFIENSGFGIRPGYVYRTWWHKHLTPFGASIVMTMLCVPLAAKFRRGGGLGYLFAAGVGLGFIYFVVDGIMLSLGEMGIVASWIAAWLPVVLFGLVSALLLLRTERI